MNFTEDIKHLSKQELTLIEKIGKWEEYLRYGKQYNEMFIPDQTDYDYFNSFPSLGFLTGVDFGILVIDIDFLDKFNRADRRQKATTDLLIPFALAEKGKKLGKHLNEQSGRKVG